MVLLAAAACGGAAPAAQASPATSQAHRASAATAVAPAPAVTCPGRPTGGPMVLLAGRIYDVTDPVHPRLLCRIENAPAHLFTGDTFGYLRPSRGGFEVVLHSIGSGNESVVGRFGKPDLDAAYFATPAWTPDATTGALPLQGVDAYGVHKAYVWLDWQASTGLMDSFTWPQADCVCRFGLSPMTLSISPDGEYAVAGWPVGKGAAPLRVFRLSDRTMVTGFDPSVTVAFWGRTGHRLYVSGAGGSHFWMPEAGLVDLPGATQWPYVVGLPPDGTKVAYTAYTDPAQPTTIRVYVYDIAQHQSRLLVDRPRSSAVFVKSGWVWYLEEAPCQSCAGGTAPTGRAFAMDLGTGVEQPVFGPGEAPLGFAPTEFWPNS